MKFGRWIFRLLLACTLAVGFGYLPYKAYGPQGVGKALRLMNDLDRLQRRNTELRRNNHVLRKRITKLKQDRAIIEQVARDELGMVRPEDIVFQLQ